jgi:hypothetical protein
MAITITESGMTFGPFLEEHCFHIEKSKVYIKLQYGLQIAEFLLIQPEKNSLLVVEAKSSAPNPINKDSQIKFDNYITEIAEKLFNAFSLGLALCLERHVNNQDEVSNCFKQMSHSSVKIKLLLVINGHKGEWLAPLNEALQKKLKSISKIWPLEVITINEKTAQKYKLIQTIA